MDATWFPVPTPKRTQARVPTPHLLDADHVGRTSANEELLSPRFHDNRNQIPETKPYWSCGHPNWQICFL